MIQVTMMAAAAVVIFGAGVYFATKIRRLLQTRRERAVTKLRSHLGGW